MMFKDSSAGFRFIMILFIIVASFIGVFIIGGILGIPLFGVNLFLNPEVALPGTVENINVSKYFQAINSIGLFVIPPIVFAYLFSSDKLKYIGISNDVSSTSISLVVLSGLAILPVIDVLGYFNTGMSFPESLSWVENWMREKEDHATDLVMTFIKMDNLNDLFINLTIMAILPAVGEELLFRGVFQKIFVDMTRNVHVGILITAFLFSAFHFQFFTFLPRFALGIFFGYLFVWSKGIWLPMVGHFVNNASAILFFYFYVNDENMDQLISNTELSYSLPLVIGSGLIFALLVVSIYRIERNFLKI